jgi:TRAP-type mannitol/chloroaromatic compound transport system permease large subunit
MASILAGLIHQLNHERCTQKNEEPNIRSRLTDIPLNDILRGIAPFLVVMVVGILLLCGFPEIALWLPSRFRGA